MRLYPISLLLLFINSLWSQAEYPKDAFRPPLDIPLILAGTFGELRSNHFHSGIDIKTQQRQGLPVYAIADGTVTRIKVSLWGYGKALYLAHPDGHTSVYAHLQKFSPQIEAYIKRLQYERRSFEVEVFPDFGELSVKKEDLIAYSGNTGGSSGPHLHFEIRNSISEKPVNPLLYGFEVRDATSPILQELYVYPLSAEAQVNQSREKIQLSFTRQTDGTYLADKVSALGSIGFGVVSYDRQDLAANKNGVFSVKQIVNGKVYSEFDFESFSFKETRYINTLIDYEHFSSSRKRIQRCFKVSGNKLGIYNKLFNDGKIIVNEGMSYKVRIEIADLHGNTTTLNIPVEGHREEIRNESINRTTNRLLIAQRPNNYKLGNATVYFPANTFYEDFYIDLNQQSDTLKIHDNSIPAHRKFTVSFDVSRFTRDERSQMFIARLDKHLKPNYMSTYKRDSNFSTRTRSLGTFTLARDTTAPKIRAKNFKNKQWLTNYRYLSLHISDDLSGVNTYNATLNGEWILMEYEPKTSTLTYNFDDKILERKQCELKVTVTDNVGNTTTFESSFYRN
ncbi:MAG: M23 family metallopeptidase [Flavobacteriaceae bacterium]